MTPDRDAPTTLPAIPAGTVAVLSTGGGPPHAIPVSAVVRSGERHLLLALAPGRESLARLRREPRVALTLLGEGDLAITAEGAAEVAAEALPGADSVVPVVVEVDRIQDHGQPTFTIDAGVRWHWVDAEARDRDQGVRAALEALAERRRA